MTPLHQFGEALRSWLELVPLPLVRVLFVGVLVALVIWVIRLPSSVTTRDVGNQRWDENLKPAAIFALTIQIVVYLLL